MEFILAINVGSSTIKFGLFKNNGMQLHAITRGHFKHIGHSNSNFTFTLHSQTTSTDVPLENHTAAIIHLANWLKTNFAYPLRATVHRLVHGGNRHYRPQMLTHALLNDLTNCAPLAPDHLPNAIAAIETLQLLYPDVPPVVCFDTAFHEHLPPVAKNLPLDTGLNMPELHRYGFHGLSYEYVFDRLNELYTEAPKKNIVIAHLGNGASMVAVKQGQSIDTTMGFTPTGGLMMGSRTGDLDPGVLVYLLQHCGYSATQLSELVNHRSGLKGVSGMGSDMQQLLENTANPNAKLAIDMFCHQAKKHLGALIAAMGGIDALVFTGGIGEAAPIIRKAITSQMGFAGIAIDDLLNEQNSPLISANGSAVRVYIIPTDEEFKLAQHAIDVLHKTKKACTT